MYYYYYFTYNIDLLMMIIIIVNCLLWIANYCDYYINID